MRRRFAPKTNSTVAEGERAPVRRRLQLTCVVLAAALLAGCASVGIDDA